MFVCIYGLFIFFASFSNGTTYFSIRCTPFRILYRYACGRFLVCMMHLLLNWLLAIEVCLLLCSLSWFPLCVYQFVKIVYDCFRNFSFLLCFCKMARKIFFKISLLCFIAAKHLIFVVVVVCLSRIAFCCLSNFSCLLLLFFFFSSICCYCMYITLSYVFVFVFVFH